MSHFRLHTSNRLETLFDRLAEIVAVPAGSPLTPEVIVVQSRGMQRWLSLRLAERFGVWSNDEKSFPFPNAFIWDIFRRLLPELPRSSAFDPDILTWRIMAALPELIEKDGFDALRRYFRSGSDPLKRYQFARRMADLFDQYTVYRPEMLRVWEQGGGDEDEPWQAVLWRCLAGEGRPAHKGAVLETFLEMAGQGAGLVRQLPARVAIFGIPSLPPMHLAVFQALAHYVEINLFLLNPSREYWGDIVSAREAVRRKRQLSFEGFVESDLYLSAGNPLLASLGGLGRDFFRMLLENLDFEEEHSCFGDPAEDSLLHALQSDILMLRERPGRNAPRLTVGKDDLSVRFHSCHSPLREMEVLHDQLLDLFDRSVDLKPNDIVVMIPDIETYAPYISAVFEGMGDERRIPFRIADRGMRGQNEAADAFLKILALPGGRCGAAQVLDILEVPAVLNSAGMTAVDLDVVRGWVRETGIRWGIDAQDRQRQGVPAYGQNSWRTGLDRLLLGYACGDGDRLLEGILPFAPVEGGQAHPLGSFVDFAEKLFAVAGDLHESRSPAQWADFLEEVLDLFFQPSRDFEEELEALRQQVRRLREHAGAARYETEIPLEVVRSCLDEALQQSASAHGFLAGGVTFCALLPMRAIPFRVVVLAGMNDGVFPRTPQPAGFDLIARRPRPGDRSVRSEDRYLFLEALLSAREHLLISYVGQSMRDSSSLPPSVLVSELLDVIERGFQLKEGRLLDHLVVEHRLQAFHPAYFAANSRLFSYSRENAAARVARSSASRSPQSLVSEPLEEADDTNDVSVDDLVRFFRHPTRFFLDRRLGIRLGDAQAPLDEREPLELDGLENFRLMNALVEDHLAERAHAHDVRYYQAQGVLPPGAAGEALFARCSRQAQQFSERLQSWRDDQAPRLDIDFSLGGYRLHGRLNPGGRESILRYRFGRIRGGDLLEAWICHLIMACCGNAYETVLVGRDEGWRIPPLDDGVTPLEALLNLYGEGSRRLLHFYPNSSLAYAKQIHKGGSPPQALNSAIKAWKGGYHVAGESDDSWLRYALRDTPPFDEDFENLAVQIFQPLLAVREKLA
ncbi:MAG: exodeoxyribonuclease V subunit gamma [Geoalkalibacter sp.]|uniref:exodeoxyribonuclease V subunit gamma n=1 Tax=Geoalkalibacter sp. TaxID=3041440 RepID=UPI003D112581